MAEDLFPTPRGFQFSLLCSFMMDDASLYHVGPMQPKTSSLHVCAHMHLGTRV